MKRYLFLTGWAVCSVLMGVGTCRADRTPSYCYDTHTAGQADFDYTVYFKHDYPKREGKPEGHGWCSAGYRANVGSAEFFADVNIGCCRNEDLKEENGKQQCCSKESPDKCFSMVWDDLKTDLEANKDGQCGQNLAAALQAIAVAPDTRILMIATADKTGQDAYNRDLAERRLQSIKQLFTTEQQDKIITINGGESNDNFTKTNGRNVEERTVRIIVANDARINQIIESSARVNVTQSVTTGPATDAAAARIRTIATNLNGMTQKLGVSVWKDKDGNFNKSRLVSDSVAGVVLGTVGGLVTSNVIKKNQIKGGFENIKCTVGGQVVASFDDQFTVGRN